MANLSSVLGRIRVTGRRTSLASATTTLLAPPATGPAAGQPAGQAGPQIVLHRTAVLPRVVSAGEGDESPQPAWRAVPVPPPRRPVDLDRRAHAVDLDAAGLVDLRDAVQQAPAALAAPAPAPAPVFESEQGAWTVEPGPSTWFG